MRGFGPTNYSEEWTTVDKKISGIEEQVRRHEMTMEARKTSLKMELNDAQEYLKENNIHWLNNAVRKISELTAEIECLEKLIKESNAIINFLQR